MFSEFSGMTPAVSLRYVEPDEAIPDYKDQEVLPVTPE